MATLGERFNGEKCHLPGPNRDPSVSPRKTFVKKARPLRFSPPSKSENINLKFAQQLSKKRPKWQPTFKQKTKGDLKFRETGTVKAPPTRLSPFVFLQFPGFSKALPCAKEGTSLKLPKASLHHSTGLFKKG